jgi:hypothetical protein
MLKTITPCLAAIVLLFSIASAAHADPLTITGGSFSGGTTGVDRTWSLSLLAGPNFSLQTHGEGFTPSAQFGLQPGSSLTVAGHPGGEMPIRGTLFLDGVTYNNIFLNVSLQFSPTTLIVPNLASGESMTFNVPFTMTGGIDFFDRLDTSPHYQGPPHFDFIGSGTGSFTFSRNVLGIYVSGIRYSFQQPDPVPEPATLILLGTGLTGIAAVRRRRSR